MTTKLLFNPVDTTPPSIDYCPDNIKETVEIGITTASVSWTEPTASDLSGNVILSLKSRIPRTFSTLRDTQVMYIFVDASGNEAVCEFFVSFTYGNLELLFNSITNSIECTFLYTIQIFNITPCFVT